jgi:hypothetical protein
MNEITTDNDIHISMSTTFPDNIEGLRDIIANDRTQTHIKGALSAGDGGGGLWVFNASDLSYEVTNYPHLFIAPNTDKTGKSGAWSLDIADRINAIQLGVGLKGLDTSVDISDMIKPKKPRNPNDINEVIAYNLELGKYSSAIFARQAVEAAVFNKSVLDEIVFWANSKYYIQLPPRPIYITYLKYEGVVPKFKGTFATNRQQGTMFVTSDALSTEPVFKVTSRMDIPENRVTGLFMEDISTVSMDFFSVPNYNTFTDNRSIRTCYDFNFAGTQVHLNRLYAGGFKRGLIANELWDGFIGEIRILYCSDPIGSVPAVFFGSKNNDNTNNLQIDHLHVEFSPWSLELGFCEHVTFNVVKCESYRIIDATNYIVKINAEATKLKINSLHVTTQNATKTHAIYDAGQFTEINTLWCSGGQSLEFPYSGIHWHYGASLTNSKKVIKNAHMNQIYAADGTDPSDYPIILANYQRFDGTLRVSDSYSSSKGTFANINTGLIAVGTQCEISDIHLIVGSGAKYAGPVLLFKGDGSNVVRITQTAGNKIFRLAGGNSFNNYIGMFGSQFQSSSDEVIYTYGKRIVFITSPTKVSQFYGMVGDLVTIISNVEGSFLVYSPDKIITINGSTLAMMKGVPYTFIMTANGTSAQK